MRVELGAEVPRKIERDAAVARRDVPVVGHRRSGLGAIDNRAVAGVQLDARQVAGDVHAAVAGVDVELPLGAVDRDRAVAGVQRQLAADLGGADAAVAGAELELAVHPFDLESSHRRCAASNVGLARHRDDRAWRERGAVEPESG